MSKLTEIGRMSYTDPQMQNIPIRTELGRSVRDAFVSRFTEETPLGLMSYEEMEIKMLAKYMMENGLKTVEEALDHMYG